MSIDSTDEDHSIDDTSVPGEDYDYGFVSTFDDWSGDIRQYFDPSNGEAEQEMLFIAQDGQQIINSERLHQFT